MIEVGLGFVIGIVILITLAFVGAHILENSKYEAAQIKKKAEIDAENLLYMVKKEAKQKAEEDASWIVNEGKETALIIVNKAKEEAESIISNAKFDSEKILAEHSKLRETTEKVLSEAKESAELIIGNAKKDAESTAESIISNAKFDSEKILAEHSKLRETTEKVLSEAKESADLIIGNAKKEAESTAESIISNAKFDSEKILAEHSKLHETTEKVLSEARESAELIIGNAKEEAKEIVENAEKKANKSIDIIKFNLEQELRIERDRLNSDRKVFELQKSEFEEHMVYKEELLRQTSEGMIEKSYKDRSLILDGINIDEYLISIGAYNIVKENILKTDVFFENDEKMNELKNRLKQNKEKQSEFKKTHKGSSCYVYGNAYKTFLCDGILSLGTTVFDVLCENINRTVTKEGVDASIEKLSRAVKLCETKLLVYGSYSNSKAHYYEDYIRLRIEEIKITHDIFLLKEQRKEEQKELRRQREEEARAQREYEREIKKAREDEVKAKAAIERARLEAEKERADTEKYEFLQAKIAGLEEALQEAVKRGERALSMAQQTKHGTVYVISNIGSFGEGVYKIGLTRRLEPLERVHELGDASVPFPFDVHALIESDDAPALETALHQAFADKKLNIINGRKEFFRVSLDEVKEKVKELGHETEWVDVPVAPQFRDSEYFRKKINRQVNIR